MYIGIFPNSLNNCDWLLGYYYKVWKTNVLSRLRTKKSRRNATQWNIRWQRVLVLNVGKTRRVHLNQITLPFKYDEFERNFDRIEQPRSLWPWNMQPQTKVVITKSAIFSVLLVTLHKQSQEWYFDNDISWCPQQVL